MQEGGTSVPPTTPPATCAHCDWVATPRLTNRRSMSLSSSPRHGLASLHDSFTATCVADTPRMFLNLTSLILTADGRCSCTPAAGTNRERLAIDHLDRQEIGQLVLL